MPNKLKDRVKPDFIPDAVAGGDFIPDTDTATPTGAGGPGTPLTGLPPIGGPAPMQKSQLMERMTGAPLTGMESGLPSPAQIPENQEAMGTGAAIGSVGGGVIAGGARALPGIMRTMAGGAVGSAGGGLAGREIGGMFGPQGREILGTLGALGGGLYGGYRGARGRPVPGGSLMDRIFGAMGTAEEPPVDPYARIAPGPTIPKGGLPQPKPPKLPGKSTTFEPVGTSSTNPSWKGELPKPSSPAQPFPSFPKLTDRVAQAKAGRGTTGQAQPPYEPLVWESEEEAQAHDVRAKNVERQAKAAGMFSAAQGKVGKPLNYQQRIGKVEGMTASPSGEQPITSEQLQSLRERMMPENPNLTQAVPPKAYTPSEKAATMSAPARDYGPEFNAQQREEMIARYKGILRHPQATPQDIAEAKARLTELGAVQ